MPNWTTNELRIDAPTDEAYEATEKLIFNDEGCVDFNVLVPMPAFLKRVVAPIRYGENGRVMLRVEGEKGLAFDSKEATEEEQAQFEAAGATDWYTWSCNNWGVKWNANSEPGDYIFDTPWDAPQQWMDALKRALPDGVTVTVFSTFEGGEPSEQRVLEGGE